MTAEPDLGQGTALTQEQDANTELLRTRGWTVIATSGPYCTAWNGRLERLFIWQNGAWKSVASR